MAFGWHPTAVRIMHTTAAAVSAAAAFVYHGYMWWTNGRSKGETWHWHKGLRTVIAAVAPVVFGATTGNMAMAGTAGYAGTQVIDNLLKAAHRYLPKYVRRFENTVANTVGNQGN